MIPSPGEDITTHVVGYLSVYPYPFTLGPIDPTLGLVDPVILYFYHQYQVTLGHIYPSFWRIINLIRYFSGKVKGMP